MHLLNIPPFPSRSCLDASFLSILLYTPSPQPALLPSSNHFNTHLLPSNVSSVHPPLFSFFPLLLHSPLTFPLFSFPLFRLFSPSLLYILTYILPQDQHYCPLRSIQFYGCRNLSRELCFSSCIDIKIYFYKTSTIVYE